MTNGSVTWYEMIDDPTADSEIYNATMGITSAQKLRWASNAQYLLQRETKAVRREVRIDAREIDTDESTFDINDDIWDIPLAELADQNGITFAEIKAMSFGQLRKAKRQMNSSGVVISGRQPCDYAFAVDKRTLYFNPVPAFGTTIIITYHPFLLPYTTERGKIEGDWSGCSEDTIEDWAKQNGPESEFYTEIEAIKAYTAKEILGASSFVRQYAYKYKEYGARWDEALADARSRMPDYTLADSAPYDTSMPR